MRYVCFHGLVRWEAGGATCGGGGELGRIMCWPTGCCVWRRVTAAVAAVALRGRARAPTGCALYRVASAPCARTNTRVRLAAGRTWWNRDEWSRRGGGNTILPLMFARCATAAVPHLPVDVVAGVVVAEGVGHSAPWWSQLPARRAMHALLHTDLVHTPSHTRTARHPRLSHPLSRCADLGGAAAPHVFCVRFCPAAAAAALPPCNRHRAARVSAFYTPHPNTPTTHTPAAGTRCT